jgi:hypothetical protein
MIRLFPADAECIIRIHAQLEYLKKIGVPRPFYNSGYSLSPEQLSTMIETAFWAGLVPNEGRTTRVALAIGGEDLPGATAFVTSCPYEESVIAKLAPAVPVGHCLGVSVANGTLRIWGFAPAITARILNTVRIELAEPGTVRVDVGPFRPYAVLDGRSNDIIAASGSDLAHYLYRRLRKAFPEDDIIETQATWRECLALAQLVRLILGDGHGGTVLLVPDSKGEWEKSLKPFPFRFNVPNAILRDVIRKELEDADDQGKALVELSQASLSEDVKNRIMGGLYPINSDHRVAIEMIATFAKVDGAVVMTRDMQILGFGAKIAFQSEQEVPVCKFKPVPNAQEVLRLRLEDTGGMRHQSAARFVEAQRDAAAIVVSQDRHVSLMNWDDKISAVCVVRNAEWWV